MRILVVHQFYLQPGQSGGSRFNEMTRFWSQKGHDVSVIAGTIDHDKGKVPEKISRPMGHEGKRRGRYHYRCAGA